MKDYPSLKLFFGSYFHQDRQTEAASDAEVVAQFRAAESAQTVAATVAELRALQAQKLTEPDLRRIVCRDLFNHYDPARSGQTYEHWLARLEALLSRG